jgi:hypothetical protein
MPHAPKMTAHAVMNKSAKFNGLSRTAISEPHRINRTTIGAPWG